MADVHIVCVREDEPQAKALAEMFEAAGFSIGGAPSSDAALRSSGAGVVVWSQASIRSRPFLDAAQRVINADKAVVASLIEPPPPSSIGEAPAFDLSDWNGDPNDSCLDPLFFAVDRMVNSQRTAVGAAPSADLDEPPPPPRPARRDPPPRAPAYAPPPAPADPLRSETEHWRVIRDSRNPADFMDYLARYGPDGAFAEVAELRLKQLTERAAPAARAPAPAVPLRPRPEARREPPPSVRPPPPPPRREPPPTMVRREPVAPPPRRINFDRPPPSYDRNELRDPPKQEGGPLRAFVLIAILGGVALAGGLYFGGNLIGGENNRAPQAAQQQADNTGADAPSAPPSAEQVGTPLSEAATPSGPLPQPTPPRRQIQQQPPPRHSDRAASATAAPQPAAASSQPRREQLASNSPAATPSSSGGPISLSGPGLDANPGPSSIPTSASGAPAVQPTSAPAPAAAIHPTGIVSFTQRPTARHISELYPSRALRDGVGGRVVLDCSVGTGLDLACNIVSETPSDHGFGQAALTASRSYRAAPTLSDGSPAVGSHARVAMQFQAPTGN
jgi:hypothetical protein